MEGVANPSRRDLHFPVGARAWLSTSHLPLRLGTKKLAAKWTGPYRVLARVTDQAYKLEVPASWQLHPVFHVSQLKEVSGNPRQEAEVVLESGDAEFEVERVLGSRVVRGRK